MKQVVSIDVKDSTPMSDRMVVHVDGRVHGIVFLDVVEKRESPVAPALVALGFDSVQYVDEAGHVSVYELDDLMRGQPSFYAGKLPAANGIIRLTRRWSEPLEDYRLDVALNGTALKSVDAHMNVGTLRAILVQLGFTVGHNTELAQAA
ncbi:hypothetical protein G3A43_07590 [Paraburkholderia aspalathi]|nr:hypothetical protein [Paraburkholderia aspalathi]MBK3780117.1 hypothetical protein [Paraburkholderia aspalathi]